MEARPGTAIQGGKGREGPRQRPANSRIHVLNENRKFLDAWPNIRRYWLLMSKDQHLWVTDGIRQEVPKYDLTGKLLYSWGGSARPRRVLRVY